MGPMGYGIQLRQKRREIAARKAEMPTGAPEFYVVVWHDATASLVGQPAAWRDGYNLCSEIYTSLPEALSAHTRLVSEVKTKAGVFDSNLHSANEWSPSNRFGSIRMSHITHQHAGRRILAELDQAVLQKRQRTRRLIRGVVRATVQLLAAQRRAAERVYAPGATGYQEVRTSFETAKEEQQQQEQQYPPLEWLKLVREGAEPQQKEAVRID